MRYLVSTFRILVLVAVVLSIASFSDVNKAQAASGCSATACNITETGTIKMVGNKMLFSGPSNFEIKTNIPTIISGNIIVTTYGALTFLNLTINNGAKLTQETIAISDIDSAGKLKPTGQDKKVDLTVTGTLSLINSGRIDVSAKGFPGGVQNSSHPQGYGPGGGTSGSPLTTLSGGAYGGKSCTYQGFNNSTCVRGGSSYGDANAPYANGSGGGANTTNRVNGARGGGIVKITADQMFLDHNDQTYITASGGAVNMGTIDKPDYRSGGGAGGSIWLKVTTLTVSAGSVGPPTADGYNQDKTTMSGAFGLVGKVTANQTGFGKYINANGNALGGAGGLIKIEVTTVAAQNCRITSGDTDTIPAECEGKDVTVVGTTINMNKVTVNATTGAACPNALNDPACDSKRHFKSLTIENGAIITNEALTRADTLEDLNHDKSLADQPIGQARWKKVDIEVTGAINFKSGGKIDVTGKGYPGAYFSWNDTTGDGNKGCDGNEMGHLVGVNGINPDHPDVHNTQFLYDYGFGPGGGIAYNQRNNSTGGGGSFAGYGKSGTGDTAVSINLPAVNYLNSIDRLEWGSGGGAASHRGTAANVPNADVTCANGGAGGGIINLKADTLNMAGFGSEEYMIIADGQRDVKTPQLGPNTSILMFQGDGNNVSSGGGSGGVVRLGVKNITPGTGGLGISVDPGTHPLSTFDYSKGKIEGVVPNNLKQVSARGGNRSEYNLHPDNLAKGGAGGGGGWIVLGAATGPTKAIKSKKIEAIVTWKEGTSDKTVKLYDILRSVVTN